MEATWETEGRERCDWLISLQKNIIRNLRFSDLVLVWGEFITFNRLLDLSKGWLACISPALTLSQDWIDNKTKEYSAAPPIQFLSQMEFVTFAVFQSICFL